MKKIRSVFIATSSFGKESSKPIKILKSSKFKFKLNPLKKKLNENELIKNAKNYPYVIAGTEKY